MDQPSITFNYGDKTESLLKSVLAEMDDTLIDQIEVNRDIDPGKGLASEPITIAATISASSVLIVHITRIIERWLERRRQTDAGKLVLQGYQLSNEAGEALKELEMRHADVSTVYTLSEKIKKQ